MAGDPTRNGAEGINGQPLASSPSNYLNRVPHSPHTRCAGTRLRRRAGPPRALIGGAPHGVQGSDRPTANLHPPRPNGVDYRAGRSDQLTERKGSLLLRYAGCQQLDHLCQRRTLGATERRRDQLPRIPHIPHQSVFAHRRRHDPVADAGPYGQPID